MSLNSNVLIGRCNLPVTERARLLGHSVETNLKHYSFAGKDNMDELKALLNGQVSPEKGVLSKKKKPGTRIFPSFFATLTSAENGT